jgi:CHASE1-domain containing sensor protein
MTIDATAPALTTHTQRIDPEYVERERRSLSRHSRLRAFHWLAVFMSLVLTFSIWQYSRTQTALRTEARFTNAAEQVAELIQERLQKYELALWGGVAAMRTHDNLIDLHKWQTFAANLEIEHRYPGINGIGVIHQIRKEDLDTYLTEQLRDRPGYYIYPPHDGKIYQPITFIEPVDINAEAVGLDMVHEQNRHTALNQARDTDSAQITGPIALVQDESKQPGFLFYAPYYQSDDHDTLEARRVQFTGAIYAPRTRALNQSHFFLQVFLLIWRCSFCLSFLPEPTDVDSRSMIWRQLLWMKRHALCKPRMPNSSNRAKRPKV